MSAARRIKPWGVALVATALLAVGCSSSAPASPKSKLVSRMHETVPNVPARAIVADASTACSHPRKLAEHALLTDSKAAMAGVDGLQPGSAALRRYVARITQVAQEVGYC